MPARPEDRLRERAFRLGFDDLRITKAEIGASVQARYEQFLANNWHGTMTWMAARRDKRSSPQALWPQARTAIICSMNYGPDHDPLAILEQRDRGAISAYAQNRDYHDVIKGKLKELAGLAAKLTGEGVKVFVDTAPILEKPLAQRAGIGWQGKHTNIVSRQFGSWLFLGEILTSAKLDYDDDESDHCGKCRSCLDICPTNAFPEPYKLDARRCISYLTIEHKGAIDIQFRHAIGNRIYGCDDCLAVCPWNKFAQICRETKLASQERNRAPRLSELLELDEKAFKKRFSGSPIKRIGHERFLRNVLIATGNSGEPLLIPQVRCKLESRSPLIRAMAVWALSMLLPKADFEGMRVNALRTETDPSVREEWETLA